MIDTLSPFTRRLLACALLLLAMMTILTMLVVPGWELFRNSLARLGDARFQRVEVETIAARPPPRVGTPVPPSLYIHSASQNAADAQLAASLRSLAASAGVTLSAVGPLPADDHHAMLAVAITAEGKEAALVDLIGRIEQGRPLKRITSWRLMPSEARIGLRNEPASLRLNAQVTAVWSAR